MSVCNLRTQPDHFTVVPAVTQLPVESGAICSIAMLDDTADPTFIGTSMGQILHGSSLHASNYSVAVEVS